jgi:SpoIID/LytB domain protein
VLALGVTAVVAAAPASAAKSGTKHTTSAKPTAPAPGWVVDRVRVEPVDPGGEIDVAGVGDYRGAIEVGRQPPAVPLVVTGPAVKTSTGRSSRSSKQVTTTTTSTTAKPRPTTGAAAANAPVSLVNDVALDDYVKGIAEVPSSWPAEALKAQAVAARTYALYELGLGKSLCPTDACQVYAGLAKERAPGGQNWIDAVTATSGQVLLYKSKPILAMYSSSDGGHTVAGSQPYLKAVDDPDDNVSPLSQWQVVIPFDVLTSVFATPMPVLDAHRTAHDTVELIWNNDDGTTGTMDIPTAQFGLKLNATQPKPDGLPRAIPSLRFSFVVDQEASTLTINGEGFGHGIGMSQYGAMGKASRGMKAADILAAYYGGITPVKLTGAQLPATIKVTLADTVSSPVTVSSPGHFRLLGPDGSALATLASGSWQIVPGPKGVRVVPPPDQTNPPVITIAGTGQAAGAPTKVRFQLSSAAYVSATATAVGQPPLTTAASPMEPGDHELVLPQALADGSWTVTVRADAGGTRVATSPVTVDVGMPTTTVSPPLAAAVAEARPSAPRVAASPRRAAASGEGIPLAVGMTGIAALTLIGAIIALRRRFADDPEQATARLL